MLDRFIEVSKKTFLYILGPLAAIVGYILYLLTKVDSLKAEAQKAKATQELAKALDKKTEVDNVANTAVDDYESAKLEYERERAARNKTNL